MKKWENFTRQEIEEFVKESYSFATLAEKIGYSKTSGNYLYALKMMVDQLCLDTSHFTGKGWNKNNFDYSRFKQGVVIKSSEAVNALSFIRGRRCENCLTNEWLGMEIPLEVHHKDGDSLNNSIENLELLCPNCHALTENYRGRNINGKQKVSDDDFIMSLRTSPTIRQALIKLGLTPRGENYKRAKELAFKHNISHLFAGAPRVETA